MVISGAGGAVGSHVGQIAKIKGCKAVGITGSDDKGKWLVNELGFDAYVNYKDPNFTKSLSEATPQGIDCYFDNVIKISYLSSTLITSNILFIFQVGGEISSIVLNKMNKFGRVAVCGAISTYNSDADNLPKGMLQ